VSTDVTDATFEHDVLDRSIERPVVVDLWAEWCGPCRTLGPILEAAVDATEGAVELVKVNVDENPQISAAFAVQSIPAVFAIANRQVVDTFIGAQPDAAVRSFVSRLVAQPSEADTLVAAGDEASLRRALELQADHPAAVVALAEILVERGDAEAALSLLGRIPENPATRRIAALARLATAGSSVDPAGDVDGRLDALLAVVKEDDAARQEFLDVLEALDPDDPRRTTYRRALASRLF
jgi:putative thioredoxin